MLSVRELVQGLDVRVLAGDGGLDRLVSSVHTSELLDPTPWLTGGEMLLTTGTQLDSPDSQREFIDRLVARDLSGLGVGTGLALGNVPETLLEAAAEHDLPLLEVPREVPFIAVTEAVFARLLAGTHSVLRGAIAAQDKLERVALAELGLNPLLDELASLVGGAILVFDARGRQLALQEFRTPLPAEVLSALRAGARERALRREYRALNLSYAKGDFRGLALPVSADAVVLGGGSASPGQPQAWLVGVKDSGEFSDVDRLALRQAVTIVALELRRSRIAEHTERRLAADVLAAIVSGELAGTELAERLEAFGLSESVAAIVLERPDDGQGAESPVEAAMVAALRRESAPGIVASTGPFVCALVAGLPDEDLFELGRRTSVRVGAALGARVCLGVGRAVGGADARRSFNEARSALEARAYTPSKTPSSGEEPPLAGADHVATFRDLGSYELFLSLQNEDALRHFCDAILGPIEQTKGYYGGELLRSLDVFIEENGQWDRAARRLYCHRHTLRYRIRKVEELTGRNVENARDRMEFWLALRGREVLPQP